MDGPFAVITYLTAEDPAFVTVRDPQTNELIISGMGDLHLKTMITRMKNRYGVDVEIGTPKVAYKETITAKGDAQYRHKKQTGGAGQFAEGMDEGRAAPARHRAPSPRDGRLDLCPSPYRL
jgi:translation elongation factor EF-G